MCAQQLRGVVCSQSCMQAQTHPHRHVLRRGKPRVANTPRLSMVADCSACLASHASAAATHHLVPHYLLTIKLFALPGSLYLRQGNNAWAVRCRQCRKGVHEGGTAQHTSTVTLESMWNCCESTLCFSQIAQNRRIVSQIFFSDLPFSRRFSSRSKIRQAKTPKQTERARLALDPFVSDQRYGSDPHEVVAWTQASTSVCLPAIAPSLLSALKNGAA